MCDDPCVTFDRECVWLFFEQEVEADSSSGGTCGVMAPASQENCLTVTVLASISVNMNSPPSKSPLRYNSALETEGGGTQDEHEAADSERRTAVSVASAGCTCSLCKYTLGAPSSTHWPQGQAGSCQRGWDDSGRFCGLAGLRMDAQNTGRNSNSAFQILF